jgi:hypothetical protein
MRLETCRQYCINAYVEVFMNWLELSQTNLELFLFKISIT